MLTERLARLAEGESWAGSIEALLAALENGSVVVSTDSDSEEKAAFPRYELLEQQVAYLINQRVAAGTLTVLTGGPGTGKTTRVASMLSELTAEAAQQGRNLTIGLTAPTGKAATRLGEVLRASTHRNITHLNAMTIHRLLGVKFGQRTRFVHDRSNPLMHDVVVVDEASMVDLLLMARLLAAVRTDAQLILVGDPHQLSSVSAGAVLADLVSALKIKAPDVVVELTHNYRSSAGIHALAEALREGDADKVMAELRAGHADVSFTDSVDTEVLLNSAMAVRTTATAGDTTGALAAMAAHRVVCAHREGPYGVRHYNRLIEGLLATQGVPVYEPWYVGRPVLVTTNDYGVGVFNGEHGVVVPGPRVVIDTSPAARDFAPGRVSSVETAYALTVHKAQGSQAEKVTVIVPEVDSRLLTRDLLYTAITRAERHVTVVGSEAAVRAAVASVALRATGLRERLLTN